MAGRNRVRQITRTILLTAFAGAFFILPCPVAGEAPPVILGKPQPKTGTMGAAAGKVIDAKPLEGVAEPSRTEGTAEGVIVGMPLEAAPAEAAPEALPPLKGLKKSIAVMEFVNESAFTAQWQVGSGIADMLTEALIETDRFVVVERPDIQRILRQQGLGFSGKSPLVEGLGTGRFIPAHVAVTGAVAEFSFEKESTGDGDVAGTAHVTIYVEMFDTSTEQLLFSQTVEKKGMYTGADADYASKETAIGRGLFKNTPLGKATQEAVNEAAHWVALSMEEVAWRGSVVIVQGGRVYLNCGKREGVRPGQRFVVYTKGEDLTDPNSGELLGVEETRAGAVSVVEVMEKYSIAKIEQGGGFKRADVLRLE
jgi:curli biogenesis system outer membrane secretion channel CsgG